jgi:polyhydroxyalkanoate synthase
VRPPGAVTAQSRTGPFGDLLADAARAATAAAVRALGPARAWWAEPVLKRILRQAYLAAGRADRRGAAGWRRARLAGRQRLKFVLTNLIAAAAPSNNPLISPAAWKALIDTGGLSAVRGLRALVSDLASSPRVPTMVAPDAFEVGKDLAVTPGAVVPAPTSSSSSSTSRPPPTVYQYPLLIVPPMINKYYITDLAPAAA